MATKEFISEMPLSEARKAYTKTWAELSSQLPENINPHHRKFIRDYFRGQLRIAEMKYKKAAGILDGLDNRTGFREFEAKNEPLLAAIDIAITGKTNRIEDKLGDSIVPNFNKYKRS